MLARAQAQSLVMALALVMTLPVVQCQLALLLVSAFFEFLEPILLQPQCHLQHLRLTAPVLILEELPC
jgi:hypothetical protein